MDIDDTDFGKEVKKKLIDLKLTQTELASMLGITNGYLCDILRDCRYAPEMRRNIIEALTESECAVNDH